MITPGGREGDASPLGKGKRKLSDYEREVAHALLRRGVTPKSRAIAMARGIIDRAAKTGQWGRGKKAKPNVVAGAVASVAQRKSFSNATVATVDLATYTHGWKLIDADHEAIAAKMTDYQQAHAALAYHDNKLASTPTRHTNIRAKHKAAAAVYKKRRTELTAQGRLFANGGATLPGMNPARDLLFAEAAERGMIDLGMDGARWKHGFIPLNAIAAAIKAKKWHGHAHDPSAPSGKTRINVGANAEHAMAPKGKARATAAQRARSEKARREEGLVTVRESKTEHPAAVAAMKKYGEQRKALEAEVKRRNAENPDALKNFRLDSSTRVTEEGKSGIPSRSEQEAAVKTGLAARRQRETPEETAARIGMTFPKPTVKSHAIVGEGTVESLGKVTLKGNESYNLTTGKRVETTSAPDTTHPYPVGSVVTTNFKGNKVRARVALHGSYGDGTMTVHTMSDNALGGHTVKRSITTVRPQSYSEAGGLIHDSRGVQLGSIKPDNGGHKATFRDGSNAGTHPTRNHALAALEEKQREHELNSAKTQSAKDALDRARGESFKGNISGRQSAAAKAVQEQASRARLSIRASTYRGQSGFSVTGKDARGHTVKMWAPTRAEAEKMRDSKK